MKIIANLYVLLIALLAPAAYAQEVAVLLPVIAPYSTTEKSELAQLVVTGLALRFDIKFGEEVDHFVSLAFQEESKKKECDEVTCLRRIGAQYHAEKIVTLRVTSVNKENLLVTSNIYDLTTSEIISSQKAECNQCSFSKLKTLTKEIVKHMAEPPF